MTLSNSDVLEPFHPWQEERPTRPATRPGRPRDAQLTARLIDAACDIVVDRGLPELTVDALMARTGAGRSGIYRRWRSLDDLVWDVAMSCTLVSPPPSTGSLAGDLRVLVEPFGRPLRRAEFFVAAVWGAAQHDSRLWTALRTQVVGPLEDAVALVVRRHADRGHRVPASAAEHLNAVVQGLWLRRYLLDSAPLPRESADALVDELLVPILQRRPTAAAA